MTVEPVIPDQAPVVVVGPDQSIIQGEIHAYAFAFTDANPGDTHAATVEWGDGSPVENPTFIDQGVFGVGFPIHTYANQGTFTVQVCVIDQGGASGCDSLVVTTTSANSPPVAVAGGPYQVNEGSTVILDASSSSDPDNNLAIYEWDFDGDSQFDDATGSNPTFSAVNLNGPITVIVNLRDTDDGGLNDSTTAEVNVINADPIITNVDGPAEPIEVDAEATLSVDYIDPGVLDVHTCAFDWGDTPATLTNVPGTGSGADSCAGSNTYSTPGVYAVSVTVLDGDGGEDTEIIQFVVVYNPEGGFVIGGSWFDSTEGSYTADPSLIGKATFGFVSRYKRGQSVPSGETEFQFKTGDLNLHSTSYDWLVIAGAKAMYKGSATINGTGDYTFQVNAIDGQVNGGGGVDKFRIKIKVTGGGVIYDNQPGAGEDDDPTTALGGGSIKIHRGE